MSVTRPFLILLVEDDPGDQKLVRSALEAQKTMIDMHIASCAEDALRYLNKSEGVSPEHPWPDLILLDLNMPGMGGKEFLMYLKGREDLCAIPVVVLTTSDSEMDISECYGLHAAGYVQKPVMQAELRNIMRNMIMYWFTHGLLTKSISLESSLTKAGKHS